MCDPYSPFGAVIAGLNPGDEVIVKVGIGFTKSPRPDKDTTEVIAKVDDLSALTASGILLSCRDGRGVKPTGRHFDNFEISSLAKEIIEKGGRTVYSEYFKQDEET